MQKRSSEKGLRDILNGFLIVATLTSFSLQAWYWRAFTHDDAWISFRYAENLVNGHGLVFNPGERVEGYTNFLWTLIMSAPIAAGIDPVPVAKILGCLFSIGTLSVFFFSCRRFSPFSGCIRPAAGTFLLTLFTPFAFWAIGGLETAMFGFLVMTGLYLTRYAVSMSTAGTAMAQKWQPYHLASAASLILVLSAITRPDGLIIWFICFLFIVMPDRRIHTRNAVSYTIPFAVIFVPYFIWRWSYYGWLLPNTYYVRMGTDRAQSLELAISGMHYVTDFFLIHGGIPALLLLVAAVLMSRLPGKCFFLTLSGLWLLHLIHAGGDEKPFGRLILPLLPVYVLFLIAGIDSLSRLLHSKSIRSFIPCILLVLAGGSIFSGFFNETDRAYVRDHVQKYVTLSRKAGEWIRMHAEPGDTMAARAIGALGYHAKIPCYDLLGIVDEHIAHLPLEPGHATAHGKSDLMYIIRKQPTYIVFMLMQPEKLGYRRIRIDLGDASRFIMFKRDPTLIPDADYMANPRENQGLLLPHTPEHHTDG